MALSQRLDDSPDPRRRGRRRTDTVTQDVYNERHRLALEELVSGGRDSYLRFLQKEGMPSFLSDEEVRRVSAAAVVPRCASMSGEDAGMELSFSGSVSCSSLTYFPEASDVEPPELELGWPALASGSFRGVTRAVAHFQPSYGACIYSCKEAARRMIRSAREVIAIVTDSLTDLDIFGDLQEACSQRRVPVYILLDQSCVSSFLQMCRDLSVSLDSLQHMRVRSITGATYFLRSGAKIVGKVNERFMLIDGNRVATGSYRYEISNLMELSGQITENFDEEFRILYAQSMPVSTQAMSTFQKTSTTDHPLLKQSQTQECPQASVSDSTMGGVVECRGKSGDENQQSHLVLDTYTIVEDGMEEGHVQQGVAVDVSEHTAKRTGMNLQPLHLHKHYEGKRTLLDRGIQTDPLALFAQQAVSMTATETCSQENTSSGELSDSESGLTTKARRCSQAKYSPESGLRDCFQKLTKERQHHYSRIRSKLNHMVMLLSSRRELVELTNLTFTPPTHKVFKEQENGANPMLSVDEALASSWTRSKVKCLQ
uniref:Family with sequence similarity 83 member D n=1 Tax=Scleropages formosus TaxID=113540 RepID=A0A8C9TUH9_SCLFO